MPLEDALKCIEMLRSFKTKAELGTKGEEYAIRFKYGRGVVAEYEDVRLFNNWWMTQMILRAASPMKVTL